MQVCKGCGETKPWADFYKHSKMASGYLSKCKGCVKLQVRTHRANHDSTREYDRRRYRDNVKRRDATAKTSRAWNQKNPEAYRAHYLVSNAIRDGRLKKEPCEICGENRVHAHHEDYSKPLEVRWLCVRHHAGLHAPAKMKD